MFPIRMKRAVIKVSVNRVGQHTLSALYLPHLEGTVMGGRDDPLPIETEYTGVDKGGMTGKSAQLGSSEAVPQLERAVPGSRGNPLPIRTEPTVVDPFAMAGESAYLRSRGAVPHLECLIPGSRDDPFSI